MRYTFLFLKALLGSFHFLRLCVKFRRGMALILQGPPLFTSRLRPGGRGFPASVFHHKRRQIPQVSGRGLTLTFLLLAYQGEPLCDGRWLNPMESRRGKVGFSRSLDRSGATLGRFLFRALPRPSYVSAGRRRKQQQQRRAVTRQQRRPRRGLTQPHW